MRAFNDRLDAGVQLAKRLLAYKKSKNTIVLGLARGGIVVAFEIAKELSLPLNVLVPRKIGAPDNPELAMGAVAEDGEVWLNESLVEMLGVSPTWIKEAAEKARKLSQERLSKYRKVAPLPHLKGKTILLVDDGVATGATMLAQIKSLRKQGVGKIIAASPVASSHSWDTIKLLCDEAICLLLPESFYSVSQFYSYFGEVDDEMVLTYLQNAT